MMRASVLGAFVSFGMAACSGAQDASTGTGGAGDETFTRWTLPGVTLHRSCLQEQDHGSCGVWGRDDTTGQRLTGEELFARLPAELDADALAERAQDLLLGASGEPVLTPESAAEQRFVSAEERTLIAAPRLEAGALVFYALEGEMHPTAMQLRIERASGAVTRVPVIEVWVEQAPATETALCLPVVTCGCPAGCAPVDRVALPGGGDRYRRLDGRTPRVLYRVESSGSLEPLNEPCGEACPPRPADYTCSAAGGGCVQGALAPTTP